MRIILNFADRPDREKLISFIYDTISISDELYAKQLHDNGLALRMEKAIRRYKPFVFSVPYKSGKNGNGYAVKISLEDSIPELIYHFIAGLSQSSPSKVRVINRLVSFDTKHQFFLISPVVVSDCQGYRPVYLTDPYDSRYSEILKSNLINKYIALQGHPPVNNDIEFLWHETRPAVQKYKCKSLPALWGSICLRGSVELIRIAYNMGIGNKNGAGFGMLELQTNFS
ncbi:MAG: CRISPR-associated endoribonuclease Cas6 [Nitrospirae bacterium]|nr:CRISPR-associated endoribonuclease Cas6 [Nitrospirota bacterium]